MRILNCFLDEKVPFGFKFRSIKDKKLRVRKNS